MVTAVIPEWNAQGVIPPIDGKDPTGLERSPYVVSLAEIALRFSTSDERRKIMEGFLEFRAELHKAGFLKGFQWLDGSFIENVESIETRPPRDIDVVTFTEFPTGAATAPEAIRVLDRHWVKTNFRVDSYFVELTLPGQELVSWSTYWYSLWSHRRTQLWKGYLQIDLSPVEDSLARKELALNS